MRDDDIPEMMTLAEAAPHLRMSVSGVRRLVRRGDIQAAYVGHRWLISKAEVLRVLREGTEPPKPPKPVELAGGRQHPGAAPEREQGEDDAEMRAAPVGAHRYASFDAPAPSGYRLIS